MANNFFVEPANPLAALMAGQQGYDTANKRYKEGQIEDARKAIASGNLDPKTALAQLLAAGDIQGATLASHQASQAQQAAHNTALEGFKGREVSLAEKTANEPKYMQSKDENDNPIIVEILKDGKGFRTVSPAEIQARGGGGVAPSPARPYQQSDLTPENSGSVVGRPGERILADASFDQRFAGQPTPQPQAPQQPIAAPQPVGTMPPMPKLAPGVNQPEARKKFGHDQGAIAAARPATEQHVLENIANLDRLAEEAKAIRNDPSLPRITGLIGAVKSIPGGKAADLESRLATLKSETGFNALQTMRDSSKTGGALGSITEQEHIILQNNLTALAQAQSPEAFKKSMDRLIKYTQDAKARMSTAFQRIHGVPLSAPAVTPQSQGGGSNADPLGLR